jgi:cation transport regulator
MPYRDIKDLPNNVKNVLPEHAQAIYKEAFNSAWSNYQDPKKRAGNKSREQVARQIAWSAVKQKYKKSEGSKWTKK